MAGKLRSSRGIIGTGLAVLAFICAFAGAPAHAALGGVPVVGSIFGPITNPIVEPIPEPTPEPSEPEPTEPEPDPTDPITDPILDPPPSSPDPPSGYTRIQQSDPAVAYSGGGWSTSSGADHSSGSAARSSNGGALASFTFRGTAVRWIGRVDASSGIADVLLDGVRVATVDTYALLTRSSVLLYETDGLDAGTHTLGIKVTGGKNLLSLGTGIWVDAFDFRPLPADTTPPGVAITSPADGTTVADTVTVTVDATDDVAVAGVQLHVDGQPVGAEDTDAPYAIDWDTRGASNGTHALTAVARDTSGNTATSSGVAVTVSNAPAEDTTPPAATITEPAPGAAVSGSVAIAADASDNVAVAGVRFMVDGLAIGGEDTAPPYAVEWNSGSVADGEHTLTAVARDSAGNTATSAGVPVTVANGGTAVTRIEDTDPVLVYEDAWTTRGTETASFSGGTAASSDVAGARVTLRFSGTGVSWLGIRCELCGIATVTLDGESTTVDTYSATRDAASVELFSRDGLADGEHTLTIEVSGASDPASAGKHIVVDAFDIVGTASGAEPPPPPPEARHVDETDPALAYTGRWEPRGPETASFTGGTALSSDEPGARVTLSFTGTSVAWIGLRCEICGIANVALDGVTSTVDTFAPERGAVASELFRRDSLVNADHVLVIEVTGSRHPASGGAHVVVDGFDIEGETTPAPASPAAARPGNPAPAPSGNAGGGGALGLAALVGLLALARARRRPVHRDARPFG